MHADLARKRIGTGRQIMRLVHEAVADDILLVAHAP